MLSELTTNQKGAIAETAAIAAATRLGVEVYRPVAEGGRFDFIFLWRERLLRVQCKWAARRGDTMVVPMYSARRTATGITRRFYDPSEVDAFAAYCADLDRCYLLPIEEFAGRTAAHLRLAPCRNNQQRKVNWAADYEFQAKLRGAGP